jgi:hypothetical protein
MPLGPAQDSQSPPAKKTEKGAAAANKAPAAKVESDEEFIRRISRELRGSEPTPTEVYFFVATQNPTKRDKLIDLFIQDREAKKAQQAARKPVNVGVFLGGQNTGVWQANTTRLNQGQTLLGVPAFSNTLGGVQGWQGLPGTTLGNTWMPAFGTVLEPERRPAVELGDLKEFFKVISVKEEEVMVGGKQVILRIEALKAVDPSQFNGRYRIALFDKDNVLLTVAEAKFGEPLRLEKGEGIRVLCWPGGLKLPEWKRVVVRPIEEKHGAK